MRAELGALLQDTDADFVVLSRGKLLEADGRGQPSRPATDHDHVIFH